MKIIVDRIFANNHKILSECYLIDEKGQDIFQFKGIELPWNDNQKNISSIPANIYNAVAVRRYSNQKYALWIQDVPNRSQIMIHTANFARQLLGCLAPGEKFADLDRDGIIDVKHSQKIMDKLQKHIPLGTEIQCHFIDSYRIYGNKEIIL